MRVAIDCRTLLQRKTGDRTYVMNLVRRLPEVAPEHEYLLLFHRDPDNFLEASHWPPSSRVSVHVLRNLSSRLWTAVSLPKFARRQKVDAIHVQYIIPPVAPCPVITTIHDLSFFRFPESFPVKDRLFLQTLVPYSARRAARVITVSESARRDLVEICGVTEKHVAVTPNGVDERFRPVEDRGTIGSVCEELEIRRPYLLFVGVLQPRKNLARLIRAYGQLKLSMGPLPDLVIVGKRGWREKEIFQAVYESGVKDSVRFPDYVSDDALPPLYSGAHLFVYPSLYEGFGLPVLEAMACGTPVIASNVSSLPEVVGDCGILVDPMDVAAIAEGLRRGLTLNASEREALILRGLQQAANYSWENTARLTAAVYESVTTHHETRRRNR